MIDLIIIITKKCLSRTLMYLLSAMSISPYENINLNHVYYLFSSCNSSDTKFFYSYLMPKNNFKFR